LVCTLTIKLNVVNAIPIIRTNTMNKLYEEISQKTTLFLKEYKKFFINRPEYKVAINMHRFGKCRHFSE